MDVSTSNSNEESINLIPDTHQPLPSRTPSPSSSSVTSISSADDTHHRREPSKLCYPSLPSYALPSGHCYPSLPFPLPPLTSFPMPLPLPFPHQNLAKLPYASDSDTRATSIESTTTVSAIATPKRSGDSSTSSSKNAIPGLICLVCGDSSSGKHYGILACNGCSGFFKRSVRRRLIYRCQAGTGSCVIDKAHRNQCQACRLRKCLQMGMNKDAVQNERQPRNSATLRPEVLADMDHERILREAAAAVGAFGPPVSLAMGLASAAAHAQYVTSFASQQHQHQPQQHRSDGNPAAAAQVQDNKRERVHSDHDNEDLSEPRSTDNSENKDSNGSPVSLRNRSFMGAEHLISQSGQPASQMGGSWYHETTPPLFQLQSRDSIYETAARLLFMAVKWAKNLPSFAALPFRDQVILLEESWSELFILCAIQLCLPGENCNLFSAGSFSQQVGLPLTELTKISHVTSDLRFLNDLVQRFRNLTVDPVEFACLKAIVLFKQETKGLKDPVQVENLQDQAQVMLGQHVRNHNPQHPARFGRLLLTLPLLRHVPAARLEHLYFRHTIGSTPMEKVLCDMYKN